MLDWLILFAAIVAEVMAITAMKLTDGFKKIWPWAVVMALCFASSLYLMSLTLDTIPVGIVYATWTGSGLVLITLVSQVFFRQTMDRPARLGIGLILGGVIVLQTFSNSVPR
ncbi:multidrug efflux SMR transporter [Ideonella sp. DXS22W]|uniref:Multidrug efflux SMR transporter n=1 Tax=Pseudaquabacterium inlustre TaxID=2984192 RepID=A0ABU9CRX6_9BURK